MIYLSTQKGPNKTESEDAILVGTRIISEDSAVLQLPDLGFLCIADGVGGNKGGRTASHYILEFLSKNSDDSTDIKDLISTANKHLIEESRKNPDLSEMATTLSGIFVSKNKLQLIHVGNTRVYSKQGNYLKQLTSDHTTYNWLKSLGRDEEAEKCNKSSIIGCLGGNDVNYSGFLCVTDINSFNLLLITSDGVHDYVSLDVLEEIISSDNDNIQKCNAIIDAARKAGSEDDASVMLVCNTIHENQ